MPFFLPGSNFNQKVVPPFKNESPPKHLGIHPKKYAKKIKAKSYTAYMSQDSSTKCAAPSVCPVALTRALFPATKDQKHPIRPRLASRTPRPPRWETPARRPARSRHPRWWHPPRHPHPRRRHPHPRRPESRTRPRWPTASEALLHLRRIPATSTGREARWPARPAHRARHAATHTRRESGIHSRMRTWCPRPAAIVPHAAPVIRILRAAAPGAIPTAI